MSEKIAGELLKAAESYLQATDLIALTMEAIVAKVDLIEAISKAKGQGKDA